MYGSEIRLPANRTGKAGFSLSPWDSASRKEDDNHRGGFAAGER